MIGGVGLKYALSHKNRAANHEKSTRIENLRKIMTIWCRHHHTPTMMAIVSKIKIDPSAAIAHTSGGLVMGYVFAYTLPLLLDMVRSCWLDFGP